MFSETSLRCQCNGTWRGWFRLTFASRRKSIDRLLHRVGHRSNCCGSFVLREALRRETKRVEETFSDLSMLSKPPMRGDAGYRKCCGPMKVLVSM